MESKTIIDFFNRNYDKQKEEAFNPMGDDEDEDDMAIVKSHHKRRLIQPPLVALLASRLAPGGTLHCATDWQPYAEQMLEVLSGEPLLVNTVADRAATGGYAPRPDHRPLTKFENRGLRLGHGVWDLVFRRA
jgi:tRNA (guanine-N7-)-methyltransferase